MKHLFTFLLFTVAFIGCKKDTSDKSATPAPLLITDGLSSPHLLLGNPSNATNDPAKSYNYLLLKDQYVASYNTSLGGPSWTAWHLGKSDLGSITRKDDFRPDDTLPDGFHKILPSDYTSDEGFDRGHMCPSADRTNSQVDNSATFLMTNILPQAPELNRGIWEEFESFCREQVYNGNELYIYAGCYGLFGTGSKGTFRNIAKGWITVPSNYYKIVLILPEGENDLARINENTIVIAVDMPNHQNTANGGWEDYITSVSFLENKAEMKFWSKIPYTIASKLKTKFYNIKSTTTPPTSSTTTPSNPSTPTTPSAPTTPTTSCGYHNGKKLYKGPEGGCYYINSNGNKTYVSRSECTC